MPTPTHGPDAPVPQPDPVAASPAPASTAPDPSALVPLTELAPAIQQASVSRRAFLGFGLAITGAMVGAAGLAKLFPVFADDSPDAYPISPRYDPSTRQWTFVVDTASCIGCGMCVVACKEENNVPEEGEYTRTWIERHVQTADGVVHVDAPEGGQHGFPPDSTAPGVAGRAVEASWFEPRLCMQCENSPCTSVCPVGATYKTEDGRREIAGHEELFDGGLERLQAIGQRVVVRSDRGTELGEVLCPATDRTALFLIMMDRLPPSMQTPRGTLWDVWKTW